MKKSALIFIILFFTASIFAQKPDFSPESVKNSFGSEISVSPMDSSVKITKDTITLSPKKEGVEYKISGYFKGQLVNKTKNTVVKLSNVYIENPSGEAAIYGEAKTEISAAGETTNYIISSGSSSEKTAALQCKKNIEIGGSGTLYVTGDVYHAVKGDDVKIKGSGNFYFKGTKEGSGINCENLIVEKDKSFKAYFLDSKNGIKADFTIAIESGNFFFYDNATCLKTDTKKDDPKSPHSITLFGGTFTAKGNSSFYKTEEKAYKTRGAKIIEN